MKLRTSVLAGLSILVGGVASLSAPGFAQQLPLPGQLEQYLPPLTPTPEQAVQADQRQGASVNGVLGGGQALATRPDYTSLLGRSLSP